MIDIHAIRAAAYCIAVDGEGFRFLDANQACLDLSGISRAFQPGLTPSDIFPPDVAAALVEKYQACRAGQAVSYASSATVGGDQRHWRTMLFPVGDADGRVAFIYGICSALDDKSRLELSSPGLSAVALQVLDGGFWTLDLATAEFRTSRGLAEKIAGPGYASLNLAEYVGYIHADDLSLEMPNGDSEVTVEFRVFTYDGRLRWLRTRRRPLRDPSGRATHVIGIVLDITEQKFAMMRLEKEAATDKLTRVANRRAFDRQAERCFGDEGGQRFGILVVDLDGFKPVNDRYGHQVGDALLREAGARLTRLVAPGDLLSRIGGDEFAVLMPETTTTRMDALAERIESAFCEPFYAAGVTLLVGASCGRAIPAASDRSVGTIVARADQELYAAKERRRRLIA